MKNKKKRMIELSFDEIYSILCYFAGQLWDEPQRKDILDLLDNLIVGYMRSNEFNPEIVDELVSKLANGRFDFKKLATAGLLYTLLKKIREELKK